MEKKRFVQDSSSYQVDDTVFLPRGTPLCRHLADMHDRLRIIGVDVEDWGTHHLQQERPLVTSIKKKKEQKGKRQKPEIFSDAKDKASVMGVHYKKLHKNPAQKCISEIVCSLERDELRLRIEEALGIRSRKPAWTIMFRHCSALYSLREATASIQARLMCNIWQKCSIYKKKKKKNRHTRNFYVRTYYI